MAKRQPVKPLNPTADSVAKQAEVERQRKAESRAALKAAKQPATEPKPAPQVQTRTPEQLAAKHAAEQAAMVAALTIDARAVLGEDATDEAIAAYIADQTAAPVQKPGSYQGPMLILRQAAKSYTKMANGNPSCADELANLLGSLTREAVCTGLMKAMKLESNPYSHLNPGQQSMNLRNKARGQIKNGLLTLRAVLEAINTTIAA